MTKATPGHSSSSAAGPGAGGARPKPPCDHEDCAFYSAPGEDLSLRLFRLSDLLRDSTADELLAPGILAFHVLRVAVRNPEWALKHVQEFEACYRENAWALAFFEHGFLTHFPVEVNDDPR